MLAINLGTAIIATKLRRMSGQIIECNLKTFYDRLLGASLDVLWIHRMVFVCSNCWYLVSEATSVPNASRCHFHERNMTFSYSNILTLGIIEIPRSANTHILCKGKHHCMADILFYYFGFNQRSQFVYNFNVTKLLNINQSNRRLATHWSFPLQSKWVLVFSNNWVEVSKDQYWHLVNQL